MVATNEKVQFDFNADFADSNYKSCFARSVVVNSQFHTKSLDFRQLQKTVQDEEDHRNKVNNAFASADANSVPCEVSRLRKESAASQQQSSGISSAIPASGCNENSRRLSCCSNASGGRNSRRGSDLPVENLALQSQVNTLQWQLKQAEASRQMYRAVMQQVVNFLERAHRSLDLLSEKQRVVQRSRSEYHVAGNETAVSSTAESNESTRSSPFLPQQPINSTNGPDAYSTFRDFTWRRPKRQQASPDEIPPEKLSQEAFRLLRTAQSLLNTREPNLAHVSADLNPKDEEFLSQLAKEFPSRPQRATSFSVNPQLISPSDRDIRISTAFNRKLSLQRTPTLESRRNFLKQESAKKLDLAKNHDSDYCLMTSNVTSLDTESESKRNSVTSIPSVSSSKKNGEKAFFDAVINRDKPPSPKTGSVSSAEDESGFSSMNSFQEVGLPLINSTVIDNESLKNGDISVNSSDSNITQINLEVPNPVKPLEKSKIIWNRADLRLPLNHRRWSSTPADVVQNDPLKVLWV